MENRVLVGVVEMAAVLAVPKSWLYERVRHPDCTIPHVRIGKYVRFEIDKVLEYFRNVQSSN